LHQLSHLAVVVVVQTLEPLLDFLVALAVEVEETEAPLVEVEIHHPVAHLKAVMEVLEVLQMCQAVAVAVHLPRVEMQEQVQVTVALVRKILLLV